jgi:hypothetical protein
MNHRKYFTYKEMARDVSRLKLFQNSYAIANLLNAH